MWDYPQYAATTAVMPIQYSWFYGKPIVGPTNRTPERCNAIREAQEKATKWYHCHSKIMLSKDSKEAYKKPKLASLWETSCCGGARVNGTQQG